MYNSPKRAIRSRRTKDPCLTCYLHKDRCICDCIPRLNLRTRVTLVIHHKELYRSTNTGRLAHTALINSELLVRGLSEKSTYQDLSHLIKQEYTNLLFYPASDAVELNKEFLLSQGSRPLHLIVPDGNWRQASKVHYRHKELANILRIKISTPNVAALHLRRETTKEGMATLEAIAHALGFIENEQVKQELMNVYWKKLQQTFLGRGYNISDF